MRKAFAINVSPKVRGMTKEAAEATFVPPTNKLTQGGQPMRKLIASVAMFAVVFVIG